ncbi:MAG: (Fe-S)-binding protein [Bacteroidota bacterium]
MNIENIIFLFLFIIGMGLFIYNVLKVRRNILLGKNVVLNGEFAKRWKNVFRVALGQSKTVTRPIPGILHFIVYVGFIVVNIEFLEILIDGTFGTHRVFSFLGKIYILLIACFEWFAILVIFACAVFLIRRNLIRLKRFWMREMTIWPRSDANIILTTEILLMTAFLSLNASDYLLQLSGNAHYFKLSESAFPISIFLSKVFIGMPESSLIFIERFTWWFHIIGIFAFMNYLPYSKHFHILLSFPNVYYSKLFPKGQLTNLESVTREVKMMLDTSANPVEQTNPPCPEKFGAKDVFDLSWKQLMDAYSCTECGRCSSVCPATQTGKFLSPRKIMMDTRDRLEEVGKNIDMNKKFVDDGKSLFGNYILPEEIWACTTCNACVQECPVNIDQISIIIDIRRFLVMEQSSAPQALNMTFTNIENNGAPWQFSPADRLNWSNEK